MSAEDRYDQLGRDASELVASAGELGVEAGRVMTAAWFGKLERTGPMLAALERSAIAFLDGVRAARKRFESDGSERRAS